MAHMDPRALAIELVGRLMNDKRNYRDRTITVNPGPRSYGGTLDVLVISVDEAESIVEQFVQELVERLGIKDPDEE